MGGRRLTPSPVGDALLPATRHTGEHRPDLSPERLTAAYHDEYFAAEVDVEQGVTESFGQDPLSVEPKRVGH